LHVIIKDVDTGLFYEHDRQEWVHLPQCATALVYADPLLELLQQLSKHRKITLRLVGDKPIPVRPIEEYVQGIKNAVGDPYNMFITELDMLIGAFRYQPPELINEIYRLIKKLIYYSDDLSDEQKERIKHYIQRRDEFND